MVEQDMAFSFQAKAFLVGRVFNQTQLDGYFAFIAFEIIDGINEFVRVFQILTGGRMADNDRLFGFVFHRCVGLVIDRHQIGLPAGPG